MAAVGRGCFATAEADMILVQNCRMIDPASQTDSLRDILIGEDRITKSQRQERSTLHRLQKKKRTSFAS